MIGRLIILFCFMLGAQHTSLAAPLVDLTCLNVDDNGDVMVNWTISSLGTCTFSKIEIFSVNDGLITTINSQTTSQFFHIGADASLGSKRYYLVLHTNCSGSGTISNSDTLATIYLNLVPNADNSIANLSWNSTRNPINIGDSQDQEIKRRQSTETIWTTLQTQPYANNSYSDKVDVCHDFLSYMVDVKHVSGCYSRSNIITEELFDNSPPNIPIVSRVTVDTANDFVKVFWDKNKASDTYGYKIFRFSSQFNTWDSIGVTYGINSTYFNDFDSEHYLNDETYRVAAFDSCLNNNSGFFNTSAGGEGHTTIHLNNEIDHCAQSIKLSWTAYNGWEGDEAIDHYDVIVKKNNQDPKVIAVLTPDRTIFLISDLSVDSKYTFFIRGVSSSGILTYSNKNEEFMYPPSFPKYHYISTVTHLLLSDEIELELYTDSTNNIEGFELERKGPTDVDYNFLANIKPNGSSFYYYLDSDIEPSRGVYEYRVNILDTCGSVGVSSNIGKTIYLTQRTDQESLKVILNWTEYGYFNGDIKEYKIYRGREGEYGNSPIASVNPGVRSFVDDLNFTVNNEEQFCYKIEAVENVNQYDFSRTSLSNEVCVVFEPIVFFPNAIVFPAIDPRNEVFKPVINLIDYESYHLQVYNRYGELIFESKKVSFGWDGRLFSTALAPEGVYAYRLSFADHGGKEYEYKGTFNFFRDN